MMLKSILFLFFAMPILPGLYLGVQFNGVQFSYVDQVFPFGSFYTSTAIFWDQRLLHWL